MRLYSPEEIEQMEGNSSGLNLGPVADLGNVLFQSISLISWFFSFLIGLMGFWFGHISMLMMILELFIIGLSVVLGGINPVKIINNYITLHYKILYLFFMLAFYLLSAIYNGIVALTTWIP